jgi:hypothetical protein
MLRNPLVWLGMSLLLFASSGASCPWMVRQPGAPIPQVLPASAATLDQVMAAVNENTARAKNGVASQAYLTVPGVPRLSTDLAFETPHRFRLKARTALTGDEMDVGMNDEVFWLWVRRNVPPALYFCRLDQFPQSNARRILPVEPDWLVEALGLPTFSPSEEHQGPLPVGAGRLEIRSRRHTRLGDMTKVTIVDAQRALVLAQHLYDAQGRPVASSLTSNHIRDGLSGVNMPRQIELQLPATQLQMRIDVVDWQINSISPQQAGIWTMPDYASRGSQPIDLADPNLQFMLPGQPLSGAAIDPRAHGGLQPDNSGWSSASPASIAAAPGEYGAGRPSIQERRARLRGQYAPTPPVDYPVPATPDGAAPDLSPIAPPAIELPAAYGPLK